jgi:hypothetical protein
MQTKNQIHSLNQQKFKHKVIIRKLSPSFALSIPTCRPVGTTKNILFSFLLAFHSIYISFRRVQVNQLIENVKREKEKRKKDSGGSRVKKKPIAHRTEEK